MRLLLAGFLVFSNSIADISFADTSVNQDQWQKIKHKNGISVYTQKIADSNILKVKTRVDIRASIHRVQVILDKVAQRKNWIPYLRHSKVLDSFSNTENLEYSLFSAPWPASDRDFVYRISLIHQDPSLVTYSMISESSPLMPTKNGVVRAELIESTYVLSALSNNQTRVELIFHADPKGWLPTWIINIIQKALPYLILRNLRTQLTTEAEEIVSSPME